jgi:hypothetical protein
MPSLLSFFSCTYLATSLSYSELISDILYSFASLSIVSSHVHLRSPSIFSLPVHLAGRLSAVNIAEGRPLMFNSYEDRLGPSLMSQFLDTAVNFTANKRPRRYKIDLQRHLSFVTSNLCILVSTYFDHEVMYVSPVILKSVAGSPVSERLWKCQWPFYIQWNERMDELSILIYL